MKHLFFGLLLFIIQIAQAQTCNYEIKGVVNDFHDNTPLSLATVHIKEINKTLVTNAEGEFKFNSICPGNYNICVSHIGCLGICKTLQLKNKNEKLDIHLEHHTEELDNVIVHGFSNHKEAISSVETTITREEITSNVNTNITDAIENVAGVSGFKTGNGISKPIIHGMHSSRVAIINNNSRLQDQEWGTEHDPSINLINIDRITVVKGASVLEYGGDIIGGAVILRPEKPIKKDTLKGNASTYFASNGKGFGTQVQINKYTHKGYYFNAGINFDKSGDFKAPNYYLTNTGFEKKGAAIIFGKKDFKQGWEIDYSYTNREIGILRASHIGNSTDLFFAISNRDPVIRNGFTYKINTPKQQITHHALKTNFHQRFKGLGKLSLSYHYQQNSRAEFDTRRGDLKDTPVVDLSLKTHQAKTIFEFDKSSEFNLKIGTEAQYQINFPDPRTQVKRLIPDYKKYDIGAFAIANYHFSPELIADIGIRYDYSRVNAKKFYNINIWEDHFNQDFSRFFVEQRANDAYTEPEFDFHNFSLHTGLWNQVNNHFDMRFSLGHSQRNPNPAELFSEGVHQSSAGYEIGSLFLKQEKSTKLISEFGWHYQKHDLKISPFTQYVSDYIYQAPNDLFTTIRGTFLRYDYEQTDAFLYGIDANYAIKPHPNVLIDNTISFVFAEDMDQNTPIINIPPLNGLHNVNYQLSKNWNMGANYTWSIQQQRVPNNNFFVNIQGERNLLDISTAPKPYGLLGLNAKYEFHQNKNKWQFIVNAQNLLNNTYRNYLNRLRYFSDESGTNIQLKINYQF